MAKHQKISEERKRFLQEFIKQNNIASTQDIQEALKDMFKDTLQEMLEADSPDMVTSITNKVIPKIKEWQNRPLESVYPIIFIDATYFNVKIEQSIVKRAVYIILGINLAGEKEVLGFYISEVESAKQWAGILNNLKNRGVKDILVLCADGLSGLKEAIGAIFPMVEFQRCIVHMIRNTVAFVSYKDRKELCSDLKLIYSVY